MIYTVKSVMPTGKTHDMYGIEFYVQFEEDEKAYPLWFKTPPEIGFQQEGEVVGGKFKKFKKEYNPQTADSSKPAGKSTYKDNSDGMRQGMCMNNAANYVATLEFPKALTDTEWAKLVYGYANALYVLGDLKVVSEASESVTEPTKDEVLENVSQLMAGAK
jgi:hypothetical protein